MKKILFNNIALLTLLIVSISSHTAFAKKQEFLKCIYKEFNIDPYGTTQLINKYGKIDAKTWDGNQVKIKVSIIVNSNTQNEAEDVFRRINIAFYNDAKFVKAETQISESKSNWVSWSWGNNKNIDYSINYEVYYPRGNFLDLSNKYGDSYIGYTNGAVKATIKYGNVKIDEVNNSAELNIAYGNSNVGTIKNNLTANVDYGKLNLRSAEKLDLNGDYSEFEIENVGEMRANSDYANFRLGKIGSLTSSADYGHFKIKNIKNISFNGDYTDVSINNIENYADIDMDYGGLKIDNVTKGFSELRISANYTEVVLAPEIGADYRLEASSTYGGIKVPASLNVNYQTESSTSERVDGFLGSKSAKGFIKVNVQYGDIKIR